ncbi:hypothetical protein GCM10023174_10430 [Chelativorans composti]|uniref:Uncharacterized protein n=1 Tax=Chelativorans composti TaxID=768533 RepID=A0ABW5DP38_9HYPH
MKPRRTEKQREIMGIILREVGQGRFLSIKELHEMISYSASYGAIRISVRWLERQGMLERRQVGRNTILVPTKRGYDWFRPAQ